MPVVARVAEGDEREAVGFRMCDVRRLPGDALRIDHRPIHVMTYTGRRLTP